MILIRRYDGWSNSRDLVENYMDDFLYRTFKDFSTIARVNNVSKLYSLLKCKISLGFSLIFLLVTYIVLGVYK